MPSDLTISKQLALTALNRIMDERIATLRLSAMQTLAFLISNGRVSEQGHTTIDWDVDVSGETVATGGVNDDTVDTSTFSLVPAQLRIGQHRLYHRFTINRIALTEAASRAPGAMRDLFSAHIDTGVLALARKLNEFIYTGVGDDATAGVIGLVGARTGNYAGINATTYPEWNYTINTAGADRALTRNLLIDFDVTLANRELMYDVITCKPEVAARYVKLFDAVTLENSAMLPAPNQLPNVDLGHRGKSWGGKPILEDPMATANHLYFMDTSKVFLKFVTVDNQPGNPVSDVQVNRALGVPIHIAELPSSNSLKRVFELYLMPQLQLFDRRAIGVIDRVNPTLT